MRVPVVVLARMVMNAGIDALVGLVPIAGDLVDVGWKANLRNLELLERHAVPGHAGQPERCVVRRRGRGPDRTGGLSWR